MDNPFEEGESRIVRPPSTALVIFGATGDLAHRKLLPALYNLAVDDYLPAGFVVVGVARSKLTDQEYRQRIYESLSEHSRREIDQKVWESFAANIFYQSLDGTKLDDFKALKKRLDKFKSGRKQDFNHLYYLATAPKFFGDISANLKSAGLVADPHAGLISTSIIVEKPFGNDLQSAHELNLKLRESFAENQIFRIDHYLGKETVQNILVFRFANGIFEPLWNYKYIDHIQISFCEAIGVGSRAGYFDQTGITRDVLQNHLLQILALLCIEPPLSLSDADSIRDEKVKVLRSVKPFSEEAVLSDVVRAQYESGFINGDAVKAYIDEESVDNRSETETFVALKLEIDNWRWAGVPIYIRAGKRLPKRITELTIHFKRPPGSLFKGRQVTELDHNILAIQVQPEEGISLRVTSKRPGPRMRVRPVAMDFSYDTSFGVPSPEAYERLILDAMKGDATLFTRDDEIETAWQLLEPILGVWGSDNGRVPLHYYKAGTWGPAAAAQLLNPFNHRWRRL